jgi:SAM-dependent methyltransferase
MTLVELLHGDTAFPAGSLVLEAGCGVGSQTMTLARQSPEAQFICLDISAASVRAAQRQVAAAGGRNVRFLQGDIFRLPFKPTAFDHIFVCFVLEHLAQPVAVLKILKDYLKPGGSITVIEGDHGSAYFYPDSEAARQAIHCQVELQRRGGGNAMIGRELFPLLSRAGFAGILVSPRLVYVDASRPALVDGFTRKTFTAMIEGVREAAVAAGLMDREAFEKGVQDLYRTTEPDGVFCYTFFKAVAYEPAAHP